jgi:hypothetical protein
MGIITTAAVLAEGTAAESGGVSPYVFGVTAFVVLSALLIVTLMIKVGD